MPEINVIKIPEGSCPHAFPEDDGTAKQCVERGHCGCDEKDKFPGSSLAFGDFLCPIDSMNSAMVFSAKDWSVEQCDAWIYGIVVGWGDDALAELKDDFKWSDKTIESLKLLHEMCHQLRA